MRRVLRSFALVIFVLCSPLAILLISLRLSGFSAMHVKAILAESTLYQKATEEISQKIRNAREQGDSNGGIAVYGPFLVQFLTPKYMQKKMEALIDDSALWMSGKTQIAPVVSFADVKEEFLSQNPRMAKNFDGMLKTFSEQAKAMQKEMPQDEEKTTNSTTPAPTFDIATVFENNLTFPIGQHLGFLKSLYSLIYIGSAVIGLILALNLLIILFASNSPRNALGWLSLTSFLSLLWNIVPFGGIAGSTYLLNNFIQQNVGEGTPQIVVQAIQLLLAPLVSAYVHIGSIILAVFLLIAIIAFILSFFLPGKTVPATPIVPVKTGKKRK